MCVPVLLLFSVILLARMVLIVLGLLKGPVLRAFEKYGAQEEPYNALPALLLWLGCTGLSLGMWVQAVVPRALLPLESMGVILILAAYLTRQMPSFSSQFFPYPRWYVELRDRTARSERRRIAYMWLHLSWRARIYYNSSDRAFLQWADFIILSTLYI